MGSTDRFLEGRVALVTGSTGGGMGRSIALTLAAHGADIVLNHGTYHQDDNAQAAAEAVAQAIRDVGCGVLFSKADTRKAGEVEEMVSQARETFGKIDILVNNAGGDWVPGDIVDADPEAFRGVVEAEAFGAFLSTRACLPLMRQHRWGRIISMGAYDAGIWADGPLSYAIGKGSRALLTRHLALRERKHNITVNLINPGPGHTFGFETLGDALSYARHDTAWQNRRKATPQDIADAVLYLCREEARFVTGSHLAFSID
jgi:NAD(P)-dependent dehydrogenase (short-subunit alcohol dehydrogenase family)